MIASAVARWFSQLNQQFDKQFQAVASNLRKQAKTQVWARVALDLFFTPLPKTRSVPVMHTARSHPVPPRPVPARTKRRVHVPRAPTKAAPRLSASGHNPAPKFLEANEAPTPMVQMLVDSYKRSALCVANADQQQSAVGARCARARQDRVWATGREIEGLAQALDLHIAVYMPNARGMLELRDAKNTQGSQRIAVVLDGSHFSPLLRPPSDIEVAYDKEALGFAQVPGDGNCFYHSVKAFVGTNSDVLRELACTSAEARNIDFID